MSFLLNPVEVAKKAAKKEPIGYIDWSAPCPTCGTDAYWFQKKPWDGATKATVTCENCGDKAE